MFRVRYAVKGSTLAEVKKCAQADHGKFVVLENKEGIDTLDNNQLKMVHAFFDGQDGIPAQLKRFKNIDAGRLEVKRMFSEKAFTNAKGFKIPPFTDEEEPLAITTEKMAKRAAAIPDLPSKGPAPYNPQLDTSRSNPAPEEDENEETDDMAKKSAKKNGKKSAKKNGAKAASNGASRGRKSSFAADAKIKSPSKENSCHPTHGNKPSKRYACMEIIVKNPGITYENYIKKGGNPADLRALMKDKGVTVKA